MVVERYIACKARMDQVTIPQLFVKTNTFTPIIEHIGPRDLHPLVKCYYTQSTRVTYALLEVVVGNLQACKKRWHVNYS